MISYGWELGLVYAHDHMMKLDLMVLSAMISYGWELGLAYAHDHMMKLDLMVLLALMAMKVASIGLTSL